MSEPMTGPTADTRVVVRVPMVSLRPADSPRSGGIDGGYARELAGSDATFPPILVHAATMRVIDGMHRLHAARLRGQAAIDVVYFHGDEADAFVCAVQDNLAHGRPLTRAERLAAAARIVAQHPDWSDRRVAAVTGISAGTAGSVRRRRGNRAALRVGRDGRVRPMNTASARMLAGELIRQDPDIPLRTVAHRAGISPATAQDVRRRVERGDDPVPERLRTAATPVVRPATGPATGPASGRAPGRVSGPDGAGPGIAGPVPGANPVRWLARDPALRSSELGRVLIRLLAANGIDHAHWDRLLGAVPPHCRQSVAVLADRAADRWRDAARRLRSLDEPA